MIGILALIGALWIFWFAFKVEEAIMQRLTGKGILEQVYDELVIWKERKNE